MSEMGVYRVVGKSRYRGHDPGTVFEARISPGPERRAIQRGDIELLERVMPELQPGSYRLPPGWGRKSSTQTTAPEGAFLMPKGGK